MVAEWKVTDVLGVRKHVLIQVVLSDEHPLAQVALEFLGARVDEHMRRHVGLLREGLLANRAPIVLLTCLRQKGKNVNGLKRVILGGRTHQMWRMKSYTPVCILRCILRLLGSLKALQQYSHLCGFMPTWPMKCTLSLVDVMNAREHMLHLNFFSRGCLGPLALVLEVLEF